LAGSLHKRGFKRSPVEFDQEVRVYRISRKLIAEHTGFGGTLDYTNVDLQHVQNNSQPFATTGRVVNPH
jgi:hypothetical protein